MASRRSARARAGLAPGAFMVGEARDRELLPCQLWRTGLRFCRCKVIRRPQRSLIAGSLLPRRPAGWSGKRAWADLRVGQRGLK